MGSWHSIYEFRFGAPADPVEPPAPPPPPAPESPKRPPLKFVPTYERTYRDALEGRKTQMAGRWKQGNIPEDMIKKMVRE